MRRFQGLPSEDRSIVFYAEDAGSWRFEPTIRELTKNQGRSICYVTSSSTDPVLERQDENIRTFSIGTGTPLSVLFQFLQANVMVMTMPDLEVYHIKRSKHPVHYVYMFHSIVSSHMIYRKRAFDSYDDILCVGPHHAEEVRATEELYELPPKNLIETGYGILDEILKSQEGSGNAVNLSADSSKRVLIAPTWSENDLLATHGAELVDVLLKAGHRVTVRPHSMTIRQKPKELKALGDRFASVPEFHLELALSSQGTVTDSDIMISDWSGAALEYAFGLEQPVIFVDVPRKVNNPEYERISVEPIEAQLRSKIGAVVQPSNLSEVSGLVDGLCADPGQYRETIRELRNQWVYNVGSSGKVAAEHIAATSDAIANTLAAHA